MARFRSDDWIGAQIDQAAEAREMVGETIGTEKLKELKSIMDALERHGRAVMGPDYPEDMPRGRPPIPDKALENCKARCVELAEERDRLKAEFKMAYDEANEFKSMATKHAIKIGKLKSDLARLRDLIGMAMENIGVPQGPCPANVSEAYNILRNALSPDPPASGEPVQKLPDTCKKCSGKLAFLDYNLKGLCAKCWNESKEEPCEETQPTKDVEARSPTPAEETKAEAPADLEPCPAQAHSRCKENVISIDSEVGYSDERKYYCRCIFCGTRSPWAATPEAARAAWNGLPRVSDDTYRWAIGKADKCFTENNRLAERVRELIGDGRLLLVRPGGLFECFSMPTAETTNRLSEIYNESKVESESDLLKEATK